MTYLSEFWVTQMYSSFTDGASSIEKGRLWAGYYQESDRYQQAGKEYSVVISDVLIRSHY